jgi:AcrR family transcriptional regulator
MKGAETRQRIIEQSAGLLNVEGYVATPVSRILDVVGLRKGGLYNHFRGRDELAAAAYDHASHLALSFMLEIERRPGSGGARLLELVHSYRDYGRRFPLKGGCPLLRGAVEGANGPAWLRDRAKDRLADMSAIFDRLLRAGREDGSVRKDIDSRSVALAIVATLEGAVMLDSITRSAEPSSAALDMIEEFAKLALL